MILVIAFYVYTSLAYTAIGKKVGLKSPRLAWVPLVGPIIIAFQTAKMHWWPWLLLAGSIIPFIGIITIIVFGIYTVIWHWKMFQAIGRPGWWVILMLLPIINFVILGIAAWGKK